MTEGAFWRDPSPIRRPREADLAALDIGPAVQLVRITTGSAFGTFATMRVHFFVGLHDPIQ